MSGIAQAGAHADGGAQIDIEGSTISNNNNGVVAGATIRLSNTRVQSNNQALSETAISLGGKTVSGDASFGSTPSLAPGASGDVYQ